MTSPLDDALNSVEPIYDTPTLQVSWKELQTGESGGRENLYDLSDLIADSYVVEHSFDDALPDSVTMTGSNDAAGQLEIDLLGRPGHTYWAWSAATTVSGENSYISDYVGTALPSTSWGNQLFMAVAVPSDSAVLTQGDLENTKYAWDFLGKQTSGTTTVWLYTKRLVSGMAAPIFYSDEVLPYTAYACWGVRGLDPANNEMRWRLATQVQSESPTAAVTHQQNPMLVDTDRSVFFGLWASLGGVTWTSPDTLLASVNTPTVSLAVARAGLFTGPRTQNMQATSSSALDEVAMIGFAVEPYERPNMSPTEFWSPFNADSPVVGFERDTAGVGLLFNVLTEEGSEGTRIFEGQMEDIPVGTGDTVPMTALSLARSTLNKSVNLPMVFGRREGGAIDFLHAWIAARADRFIGPAPGPYTRWWVPCYGSIHDGLGGPLSYSFGMYWTPTESSVGVRNPEFVPGPFHTAVWACHTATYTREIVLNAMDLYKNTEIWPWVRENYFENQVVQDLFSHNNGAGRISFWLRGDATFNGTPTNVPSGNRFLFTFLHEMRSPTGTSLGRINIYMEPDRNVYVQMGNATNGTSTYFFPGTTTLPNDGEWHFYSISWSYFDGEVKVRRGSDTAGSDQYFADGRIGYTGWYDTQEALYLAGGQIVTEFRSHLPFSDFIYEAGYPVFQSEGEDIWPFYQWPSFTMDTRVNLQQVAAVPDDTPVNAMEVFAELSQNTMSWYRMNERDQIELFPPTWLGEEAQQTVSYVIDTELNASDLVVVADPSKSRNVVTVKFSDTSVDQAYSTCLAMTQATEIPPGITDIDFTLDAAVAEIHGAATPYAQVWTLTNLSAAQITAGTGAAFDKHYMSVNTVADGSGTVLEERSVLGVIKSYTQTTVTVRFQNKTGKMAYLANGYQGDNQLPFLRILGYLIKQADGYATERDGGSIGTRRERSLDVQLDWIHDRATAQRIAAALVSTLARPRHEVTVTVMGDPRRVPGELVQLNDRGMTHANGVWRVLSISHNASGPEYTQILRLVSALPLGLWDESGWDESTWGE